MDPEPDPATPTSPRTTGTRESERSRRAKAPKLTDELAAELFGLLRGASPLTTGAKLTPSRRGALGVRVDEHGVDAVRLVARWVAAGANDRARFLRDRNGDVDTLLRPSNFVRYLEMAQAWQGGARVTPASPWGGGLDEEWRGTVADEPRIRWMGGDYSERVARGEAEDILRQGDDVLREVWKGDPEALRREARNLLEGRATA